MKPARVASSTTIGFDQFWEWIKLHPHCIVRAGTPEALLFDEDEFHWDFLVDPEGLHVVQLIKGKRPVGEIAIAPTDVSYVQIEPGEAEEEFVFELITEQKNERIASYHFVLSHGLEDEDPPSAPAGSRWRH